MHRGSSKGRRGRAPGPETLPLSASTSGTVRVWVELTRAGSVERRRLTVPKGTRVRAVLRSLGQSPEGSAVLVGEVSIPLDTPIEQPTRLTVLPTFSGG